MSEADDHVSKQPAGESLDGIWGGTVRFQQEDGCCRLNYGFRSFESYDCVFVFVNPINSSVVTAKFQANNVDATITIARNS